MNKKKKKSINSLIISTLVRLMGSDMTSQTEVIDSVHIIYKKNRYIKHIRSESNDEAFNQHDTNVHINVNSWNILWSNIVVLLGNRPLLSLLDVTHATKSM